MSEKWEKLGVVNIDSGTLLLTDACHAMGNTVPAGGGLRALNAAWEKWVGHNEPTMQLQHIMGHDGLGILISTCGDGPLEVLGQRDERGRIVEIKVRFPWAKIGP